MPTTFQTRAREAFEEVLSTAEFVVEKSEIESEGNRPLTAKDAELVSLYMGPDAVDQVADHLLDAEQIHLSWHTPDHGVYGEFVFKDLRTCLSGLYMPYTDERLAPAEQLVMDEIKTLEESPGSGRLTALRVSMDMTPCRELWFYDMNQQRFELLDLNYSSYADTMLLTKGIPGWQYLYTDVRLDGGEFRHLASQLERSLDALEAVFPAHDYSVLRERMEARR
ncbi:hypothetical protein QF034_000918 [Streptomyces africanus]|uniref:Uncharacterized protein n=1 Tax=Streptomyces africanus TaxID=231024 RepID=A0ABU0QH36_9ACTN|nr:hypothetical protein [Streptomyces africanus]MDQ0746687.1 hypothetical protein [Streptomyces africanus]